MGLLRTEQLGGQVELADAFRLAERLGACVVRAGRRLRLFAGKDVHTEITSIITLPNWTRVPGRAISTGCCRNKSTISSTFST